MLVDFAIGLFKNNALHKNTRFLFPALQTGLMLYPHEPDPNRPLPRRLHPALRRPPGTMLFWPR